MEKFLRKSKGLMGKSHEGYLEISLEKLLVEYLKETEGRNLEWDVTEKFLA